MGLFSKKPKEKTLWRGSNSVLTNPFGRVIKPEFYKITTARLFKSRSNAFRLGSNTESMELFRITSVRVDQGPYQKVVGLGAGDDVDRASPGAAINSRLTPIRPLVVKGTVGPSAEGLPRLDCIEIRRLRLRFKIWCRGVCTQHLSRLTRRYAGSGRHRPRA